MAKKNYYLIIDTETTMQNTVYDFGALLVDQKGNIIKECSVIISDFANQELFHDPKANDIWGNAGLLKRKANYTKMLMEGTRMLASVAAVNRWLEKVNVIYEPMMTAYNLAFDLDKMQNSGVDAGIFAKRFCLWQAAVGLICQTKQYRAFCLQNHLFNNVTQFGNMTYKTNAECVASFVAGEMLPPEPHTALEDAKFYELPILANVIKKKGWKDKTVAYDWHKFQVKDNFHA